MSMYQYLKKKSQESLLKRGSTVMTRHTATPSNETTNQQVSSADQYLRKTSVAHLTLRRNPQDDRYWRNNLPRIFPRICIAWFIRKYVNKWIPNRPYCVYINVCLTYARYQLVRQLVRTLNTRDSAQTLRSIITSIIGNLTFNYSRLLGLV